MGMEKCNPHAIQRLTCALTPLWPESARDDQTRSERGIVLPGLALANTRVSAHIAHLRIQSEFLFRVSGRVVGLSPGIGTLGN